MKIKGISPVEQHIEKLVLVVFALFAMAMFVLQFNIFGDPNAVDIGHRKNVAPAQAVDVVREEAQRLEGEIDGTVESGNEVPVIVGPLERIEKALAEPAIDPSLWVVALGPGSTAPVPGPGGDEPKPPPTGEEAYVDVLPPAPKAAAARAFGSTINPFVPVKIPGLVPLLPDAQPFDLRAVSVQASFPAQDFRAALAFVPDDEKLRPLPRAWWDGLVEILDVEVIRDELGPDGSVVASTTIPPVPGFASVRAQLANPATLPRDLPGIQDIERANRETIRRTPVYEAIAGEPWIWPTLAAERNAADPDRDAVLRLVTERRNVLREIEKIEGNQKPPGDAGGAGDDRGAPPPPPPPPGGPNSTGGTPQTGGGNRGAATGANAAVTKRIADLTKRAADIATELKDKFNRDPDGLSLQRDAEAVFTEPVASLTAAEAHGTITVWTHDLSPEPGKTYQYRVRVWVTNPLCGKGESLGPAQKPLADALAIASDWSEPTPAILVPSSPAFFVASASTGEGLGGVALRRPPSATLDVFDFHYGFWREGDATIAPGDQVRSDIKIPPMPVFEIKFDEAGAASLGETTMGPESLPIVRDVFLVTVIGGGSGDGDIVILARPDGSVELREAGTDADSEAETQMLDSASKSIAAEVAEPKPMGAKQ